MQLQLVRPSYCTSIGSGPNHWAHFGKTKGGGLSLAAKPYASYAPGRWASSLWTALYIETDHQPEVAAPNEEQESEVDTLGSITSTHQNADGPSPGPLDTTMVMGEVWSWSGATARAEHMHLFETYSSCRNMRDWIDRLRTALVVLIVFVFPRTSPSYLYKAGL